MFEHETRCLNVKALEFFWPCTNNTKTPWKYNVGGANVFQKEKEKEKEMEKEMEMEEETRESQ